MTFEVAAWIAGCAWFGSLALAAPTALSHLLAAIVFFLIACVSLINDERGYSHHFHLEQSTIKKNEKSAGGARSKMTSICVKRATCGVNAIKELFPHCEDVLACEIGLIIDNIVEAYVLSWYRGISEDMSFPNELRAVLARAFVDILRRMLDEENIASRLLDGGLDAVTHQIKAHGLARAGHENDETALSADAATSRMQHLEAIVQQNGKTLRKLGELGKLHPAMSLSDEETLVHCTTASEMRYLNQIADRLAQILLAQDDHKCRSARHLVPN